MRHGAGDAGRRRLAAAADVLLDVDAPPFEWSRAALELHALLSEITGLHEQSRQPGIDGDTRLPSGTALSPRAAARSIDDFVRTARFAQGLAAAVAEAGRRFPPPVEVLYAGCGPFAALCLPLAVRWEPEQVRFTLLDVHRASLDLAERVMADCGLLSSVRAFVEADAAAYRHPGPHALHVVLIETMGQALEREPQVAVTANLAAQLAPGGLLVPERVQVAACLADPQREFTNDSRDAERPRVQLGTVLDLTGGSAATIAAGAQAPRLLVVPPLEADGPAHLMLRTTVSVQGSLELREYESGITYPKFRHELGRLSSGQSMMIGYRSDGEPGFDCRLLDSAEPRGTDEAV